MKLEYLYKDDSYKDLIVSIDIDPRIQKEEKDINELHSFSFLISGDNLDNAKVFSELKTQIEETLDKDKLFLLTNDAGEYINKRLYPQFNKFERLLRKVLFLISIKNNNENALEIAKKLERSDFGDIYESVFTSKKFRDDVKLEVVKNTNTIFSKKEILDKISEMEEETIWTSLFSDKFKYISDNFSKIKDYRNATMHAHNMSYSDYVQAMKMIEKANEELETIISRCEDNKLDVPAETTIKLNGAILALGLLAKAIGEVMAETILTSLTTKEKTEVIDSE